FVSPPEAEVRREPASLRDTSAKRSPSPGYNGNLAGANVLHRSLRPSSCRIAPTATRYPAPSQPPQQERSGKGRLSEFFVVGMNQFFSVPRNVFKPGVCSLRSLVKSCG